MGRDKEEETRPLGERMMNIVFVLPLVDPLGK